MNEQANHMNIKTWRDFPAFYAHPFIRSIAEHEAWTVSDKDKKPIDMWDFALYNTDAHRPPTGAKAPTREYLMTLKGVCDTIPTAPNNAYYFDCQRTGHVLLDVEPACPDELKRKFLATNYVYGEVSMSGKGYHLVYRTPECFSKYPDAMKKLKMQDSKDTYEFLLEHYVTFTRILLPPAGPDAVPIDDWFEQLCARQKYVAKTDAFNVEAERPKDIPQLSVIMMVMENNLSYKKTIEDFGGDNSRYEFGYAAMVYKRLERVLKQFRHKYTQTQKAWIIYDILVKRIPYREKHDTMRDGMPWLLYVIQEMMAKNADDADLTRPGNLPEKPVYPADAGKEKQETEE